MQTICVPNLEFGPRCGKAAYCRADLQGSDVHGSDAPALC